MVAMNLRRLGVCNKFIQQILRHANVTTTMNFDVKMHSEWHEEPGNDVCNYCATREARQHTNHVEVFLGSSQQISTVDIVTVWRRGGDRASWPTTTTNIARSAVSVHWPMKSLTR